MRKDDVKGGGGEEVAGIERTMADEQRPVWREYESKRTEDGGRWTKTGCRDRVLNSDKGIPCRSVDKRLIFVFCRV